MANLTQIIEHIAKCIKSCETKEQLTTCSNYIDIAFSPKICKELTAIRIATIVADFDYLIEGQKAWIASGKPKPQRFPASDEQHPGIID
jgi:hypothetical protein